MKTMNDFKLERISLILLLGCNLKCKHCCVQAPYYEHKYYPSLEFIKHEIDRLFQISSTIHYFSLEGGETFLRKDLAAILEHLSHYVGQIGVEAPVITNGTILPDQEVLNAAKLFGDKIRFIIDDYGSLSPKAHEMCALLEREGIRYELRDYDDNPYCNGWVDLYGEYGPKHDEQGAISMFAKCAWAQKLKGVMEIIGGLIYFCPASRVYNELGLAVAGDEVVNFLDEKRSLEEIRLQIGQISFKKALSACRFCNGIHDDSARYKPAVQLTGGEAVRIQFSKKYRETL